MSEKITILFEDKHVIVCVKPAGMLSQSGRDSSPDMVNLLKGLLFERAPVGRPPYLAPVHRLDQPVGGVMVFAKTPFGAKELSRQVREGIMTKKYLAVVCGAVKEEAGPTVLTDYLVRDPHTNRSRIAVSDEADAKKAELGYQILSVRRDEDTVLSLLEVELFTGRHHQIRVQLAAHGCPIWGDSKYNPAFAGNKQRLLPALYAHSLTFFHPKTKARLTFENFPDDEIFSKFSGFNSQETPCI